MIPDIDDQSAPRMLQIRLTDTGETYLIEIERNRIGATDPDVCDLLGELNRVVDQMHREAHLAQTLLEHRN